MNKTFKELALEAGEYVNSVYTPPVRSKTPGKIWEDGHIGWNEQFQEKFAELIVRECAKFLDENSGYDECNNAWHPAPEDLLEHFGVEE